jgi:hypothetical protein
VDWQPVKLAFEQWNYKQEGLTPAGAALLAAALAVMSSLVFLLSTRRRATSEASA